ncbi:branched-chain amino acid aminotransferase [Brevibacillus agri BAB-2500]|nr:branched-chain amino acid aminotransferase [Brevibacillus agri BAB-2500]
MGDNAIPPRAKTTGSYINAALATDDAIQSGYDDGVMLTSDGHVAEGTSSNLFMVRGNTLITSPVSDGILEGITRQAIMELAKDAGLKVETRTIDRSELYVASEIFLCGTGVQISPVYMVDHRKVGSGMVGEITLKIKEMYFDAVRGKNRSYQSWLTPVYRDRK